MTGVLAWRSASGAESELVAGLPPGHADPEREVVAETLTTRLAFVVHPSPHATPSRAAHVFGVGEVAKADAVTVRAAGVGRAGLELSHSLADFGLEGEPLSLGAVGCDLEVVEVKILRVEL